MATIRIIPIRKNKGKTTAQTITERIDYATNPKKTNEGKLVSGYECDPRTVSAEFILSKKQYAAITGREQGNRDILAYHIRQAFKPEEITPEEANRIGYELALSFTKGKQQFIVATHIDKAHIHNHIIFNSTTLDCTRKFFDFLGSGRAVRRISDKLCIENGLSIIENPKRGKKDYGSWLGDKKTETWQEKLRHTIDAVLDNKPADIAAFIQSMKEAGYEVKQGKHLSFRAPGQKRFTRLRSLGEDYNDAAILERIEGKRIVVPKHKTKEALPGEKTATREASKVNLLIDVQNNIKAKNSPGYAQWAKVFNLKQAAQTLIFLQENDITDFETLEQKTKQAARDFDGLGVQIKEKERRLNEISELQKYIGNYSRTRDIYTKYREAGYSKKFYAEHEDAINLHKAAKKAFDELGLTKLPSINSLKTEYATVLTEKKKLYQAYKQAREKMREFITAKTNTERLLRYSSEGRENEIDGLNR